MAKKKKRRAAEPEIVNYEYDEEHYAALEATIDAIFGMVVPEANTAGVDHGRAYIDKLYARTKKDVVDRIRELREQGFSEQQCADRMNDEQTLFKTGGKPWNRQDINGYRREHNIP